MKVSIFFFRNLAIVGMGVSYAIFDTSEPVQMNSEDHIKTMIYDPKIHDKMLKIMMEDNEHYAQMFKDMTKTPMEKHEFTEKLMQTMDSDPELKIHVMAHMMNDTEIMRQMQMPKP